MCFVFCPFPAFSQTVSSTWLFSLPTFMLLRTNFYLYFLPWFRSHFLGCLPWTPIRLLNSIRVGPVYSCIPFYSYQMCLVLSICWMAEQITSLLRWLILSPSHKASKQWTLEFKWKMDTKTMFFHYAKPSCPTVVVTKHCKEDWQANELIELKQYTKLHNWSNIET